MSSYTRVPCGECGKLTLKEVNSTEVVFCDSFCEARNRLKIRRSGVQKTTIPKPTRRTIQRRGCGRCGG